MKKVLLLMFFPFGIIMYSQSFTKITSGNIVQDIGAWRSVNAGYINNDLYPDLFVSNGFHTSAIQGKNNMLYINDGPPDYTFTKMDSSIVSKDGMPSDGATLGDYDNDGDLDLFVVNWWGKNNMFYKNNGNAWFMQVTGQNLVSDGGLSEASTWGDYDNDGYLDLYVTNSGDAPYTQSNFLYHNKKDGTFEKITTGEIVTDKFISRGANWIDYDDDGDLDLYVTNESNQDNNIYRNMLKESGTASFQKITGINIVTDGLSSWSASWGDYDNDLKPDLFVANGAPYKQNDLLFKNNGDGSFTKILNQPLVEDSASSGCSSWGDFDNDGDLDLFVTTAYAGVPSKNLMYKNLLMETGSASFEKVTVGEVVNETGNSYGAAWLDYNNDGRLDLFVACTQNESDHNRLFKNEIVTGNNWVELNLKGLLSNRTAIGTKVKIKTAINNNAVWQMRTIEGESGYCSQNLIMHFGLGNASVIDTIIVEWPSGIKQVLTNQPVNGLLQIEEDITLGTDDHSYNIPLDFELQQNYPNPFNPSTAIRYSVAKEQYVTLLVCNALGEKAAVLMSEIVKPGSYEVEWNASDFPSGIYFYRMEAGFLNFTGKMLLLK